MAILPEDDQINLTVWKEDAFDLKEFSEQAQTKEDRFNRLVIESECEEYILNRAASLGAEDLRAEVSARWDMEGFWVPETAVLRGSIGDGERETLSQWIAADLGIAAEEQEWIDDGG